MKSYLFYTKDGQMKPKYVMAGCKSTQHGTYRGLTAIEALLLDLSDVVLDVGSDQKRSPRMLSDGTIDINDASVEQYQQHLTTEEMKKKNAEVRVASHSFSNKKRKTADDHEDDASDDDDDEDDDDATLDTVGAERFQEMDDEELASDTTKGGSLLKKAKKQKKQPRARAVRSNFHDFQSNRFVCMQLLSPTK